MKVIALITLVTVAFSCTVSGVGIANKAVDEIFGLTTPGPGLIFRFAMTNPNWDLYPFYEVGYVDQTKYSASKECGECELRFSAGFQAEKGLQEIIKGGETKEFKFNPPTKPWGTLTIICKNKK